MAVSIAMQVGVLSGVCALPIVLITYVGSDQAPHIPGN